MSASCSGEDDDIYNRLSMKGMFISRASGTVGKCRMIRHNRDKKKEPKPSEVKPTGTHQKEHGQGRNQLAHVGLCDMTVYFV